MAGGVAAPTAPATTGQTTGGPGMGPPSPMVQQQMYNPYQMQQAQPQQMMRTQMQPQQMSGLQAALMQMLGRYNQPMMRPQMQAMPQYQNPALAYRPNMAPAQAALRRTATTQAEAQAAAEKAALEKLGLSGRTDDDADFLNWQRQQYTAQKLARDNPYSGGGN